MPPRTMTGRTPVLVGVGWGVWHTQVVLHGNLSFAENLQVLIQASPEPSPPPSSYHSWAPSLRLGCSYAFSLGGNPVWRDGGSGRDPRGTGLK